MLCIKLSTHDGIKRPGVPQEHNATDRRGRANHISSDHSMVHLEEVRLNAHIHVPLNLFCFFYQVD